MSIASSLRPGLHLAITPSGAYYAASRAVPDAMSRMLLELITLDATPEAHAATACRLSGQENPDEALELLHSAARMGLVKGLDSAQAVPAGALSELLSERLAPLSSSGKALIADTQGFYLASNGFPHETAEELSALSAELASLDERRRGMLHGNLRLANRNWAIVDASGYSQLGFWPLYLGSARFVLVIGGMPALNQDVYASLVWILCHRYNQRTWED